MMKNYRHSPYDNDEEENVCNMEKLGTIGIYKSEETGRIYINFILFDEKLGMGVDGTWFDTKEIFPNELDEIKKKLLNIIADEDCAE